MEILQDKKVQKFNKSEKGGHHGKRRNKWIRSKLCSNFASKKKNGGITSGKFVKEKCFLVELLPFYMFSWCSLTLFVYKM